MKIWKNAALSAILAAGIAGGVAWAQSPDAPPSPPYHRGMMADPVHGAKFASYLAYMHQQLALSPQQEDAWRAFSQKMLDHKQKRADFFRDNWTKIQAATLPERLDLMDANRKESDELRTQMHKEIKDFYATLSPEQKVVMDRAWGFGGMHGFKGDYRGPGDHRGPGPRGGFHHKDRGHW